MRKILFSLDCHVASLLTMTAILFSFNAHAECTPTPDCASIGYTETSCETDYLACPFDSTKLKCIPCDSSFRYDCSGDNIIGGTGSACGGKYVSCECLDSEYTFKNGECIASRCPSGYFYYSDTSCTAELSNMRTVIGIVAQADTLVVALTPIKRSWASNNADVKGIKSAADITMAKTDFNGKANTLAIVEEFPDSSVSNNSGIYCYYYETEGTKVGDWYLPAYGELVVSISANYDKIKSSWSLVGTTVDSTAFWSSTEYSSYGAWHPWGTGSGNWTSKSSGWLYVACMLRI